MGNRHTYLVNLADTSAVDPHLTTQIFGGNAAVNGNGTFGANVNNMGGIKGNIRQNSKGGNGGAVLATQILGGNLAFNGNGASSISFNNAGAQRGHINQHLMLMI